MKRLGDTAGDIKMCNRIYVQCGICLKSVQTNKFLLGGLHVCIDNHEELIQLRESSDVSQYSRNKLLAMGRQDLIKWRYKK